MRGKDLPKRAVADVVADAGDAIRVAGEADVIESVKGFQTKLEVDAFGEVDVAHERHVPDLQAGTEDGRHACRAEMADGGRERRGAEPLSQGLRIRDWGYRVGQNEGHAREARSVESNAAGIRARCAAAGDGHAGERVGTLEYVDGL